MLAAHEIVTTLPQGSELLYLSYLFYYIMSFRIRIPSRGWGEVSRQILGLGECICDYVSIKVPRTSLTTRYLDDVFPRVEQALGVKEVLDLLH
jgi:hypothetical protein